MSDRPPDVLPFAADAQGVRLVVRLTPRGGRAAVVGIVADADGRPALQIRVAAPPVDGAANQALVAFLADALGMRKSDIAIRSGATSRVKVLHLSGDSATLAARLSALCGAG
jgi:uncharacterized protein (TIGR00251 family)